MSDVDVPPWAPPSTGAPPSFEPQPPPRGGGIVPRGPRRRTDVRRLSWWFLGAVAVIAVGVMLQSAFAALNRPVDAPPDGAPGAATAPVDAGVPAEGRGTADEGGTSDPRPASPVRAADSAAAAFGARFAHDYLSWDASNPEVRAERLRPYLAPGVDPQAGWDGEGAQVAVLALPVGVEVVDEAAGDAVVTVAVEITGLDAPRWVHLAVPVRADGAGGFAVTGPPAYVPAPPPAAADIDAATPAPLDPAATEAVAALLERLLPAYAAERSVELDGVVEDGARLLGLGGTGLAVDALVAVAVPTGGDVRTAAVDVRWRDDVTGSRFVQRYGVTVVRDAGGWVVRDVDAHTGSVPEAPEAPAVQQPTPDATG